MMAVIVFDSQTRVDRPVVIGISKLTRDLIALRYVAIALREDKLQTVPDHEAVKRVR